MGANKSNETITRQWKILELVPARSPSKKGITTKQLLHKLISAGYDLNEKSGLRTIQRDMDTLSGLFPLESEKEGKTHYWYFLNPTNLIPSDVSMEDALAISLMKDYLGKSMPLSMSEHIHAKINRSIEKLSNSACSNFSEWYKKFRIIPNSFQLQAPSIRPKVLNAIQEALINNKKIKITYDGIKTGRSTLYLCPLYLICKIEVFYLVACFKNKEDDPYRYAVHRIKEVEILDEPYIYQDSNIDEYIENKTMDFGSGEEIKFVAKLKPELASHLIETKISDDQEMPLDGSMVTATVKNTWEFKFWLMSRSNQMEILEPKELREEIKGRLHESLQPYIQ